MNKIKGYELNPSEISRICQELSSANGSVEYAMNTIEFENEYMSCFKFVFGGFFICSSTELARKCSQVYKRSAVNLEGDIFDPQGTLSGGYTPQSQSHIQNFRAYAKLMGDLENKRQDLQAVEKKISELQTKTIMNQGNINQMENLKYKLGMKKDQFQSLSNENTGKKILILEEEIKGTEASLNRIRNEVSLKNSEIKALQSEKKSSDDISLWKEKLRRGEEQLRSSNKELSSQSEIEIKEEMKVKSLKENLEENTKEMELYKEAIIQCKEERKRCEEAKKELEEKLGRIELERLKVQKRIQNLNMKASQLQQAHIEAKEKLESLEADFRKKESQIVKFREEIKEYAVFLATLEKNFPFISKEKHRFGVSGSEFDFSHFNYEEQVKVKSKLSAEFALLSRKVNVKADAVSDKMGKEFEDLLDKKRILEGDKAKLNSDIEDLEEKRKEAIEKCFKSVNENFTKIFSSLLKGATAKLNPSKGKSITESIEIHVAFGGVWKTSLSELSGGQRSLLALSFILALLMYKPAPFYILDEIDAALDLSHTANIGSLIAKHFPQSQFIIISLKEGMFSNANVLYKTSYHEGISKVERFAIRDRDKPRKDKSLGNKEFQEKKKRHLEKVSK